jgi:Short repeat of unknown function (DUF308)
MLNEIRIRSFVLIAHGVLALVLGLAFFYLRATMSNIFFEALSVAITVVLAAAALILAGLTDWAAAFSEGIKHMHRLAFYLLSGLALAIAGFLTGTFTVITLRWLTGLAALHALVFGIYAVALAARACHPARDRGQMAVVGALSVMFSALLAAQSIGFEDTSATVLMGSYLCFLGAKMLLLAWNMRTRTAIPTPAVVTFAGSPH